MCVLDIPDSQSPLPRPWAHGLVPFTLVLLCTFFPYDCNRSNGSRGLGRHGLLAWLGLSRLLCSRMISVRARRAWAMVHGPFLGDLGARPSGRARTCISHATCWQSLPLSGSPIAEPSIRQRLYVTCQLEITPFCCSWCRCMQPVGRRHHRHNLMAAGASSRTRDPGSFRPRR